MMKLQKLHGRSAACIAGLLVVLVVMTRLMPHPPNVTATAAVAIFAGALLPRRIALYLSIVAMMTSDLLLGLHPLILFTWGSLVLSTLFSSRFLNRMNPFAVAGHSLGASVLFYLVTNFGVWIEGRLYNHTLQGLLASYVNGLPFLQRSIIGDLFFTTLLFSIYALAFHKDTFRRKVEPMARAQ